MPIATSIIQKDETVIIYDAEGKTLWQTEICYLEEMIDEKVRFFPQSLHFLMKQPWITCPILYKLAKIIQDNYPVNDINWRSCFFTIEKNDYVNKVAALQNEFVSDDLDEKLKNWPGFDKRLINRVIQMEDRLILIAQLTTPEGDAYIEELAEQNLREYGIIL